MLCDNRLYFYYDIVPRMIFKFVNRHLPGFTEQIHTQIFFCSIWKYFTVNIRRQFFIGNIFHQVRRCSHIIIIRGIPYWQPIFFILICYKRILQNKTAYAIMPIGKKKSQVHPDEERNPRTVLQHSPGILLFFLQRQSTR